VLSRVERFYNDEISLLLALTICLVVAAITELRRSLPGSGSISRRSASWQLRLRSQTEKQNLPLRDAFVALFFVTIGLLIDPTTWLSSWHLVVILVAMIIAGKFAILERNRLVSLVILGDFKRVGIRPHGKSAKFLVFLAQVCSELRSDHP